MNLRAVVPLALTVWVGCTVPPNRTEGLLIEHHGEGTQVLSGLVREGGQGPFLQGATEQFRAQYQASQVKRVRWSASGGQLSTQGDVASWTLPHAEEAELTVQLELAAGRELEATFRFQLRAPTVAGVANARDALLATPMPVLDGGSSEISGGACDLEYDGTGNIHMVFTSGTHPAVYYGKWNGSAWALEVVDTLGFNTGGLITQTHAQLKVDGQGNPHLLYIRDDLPFYARRSGSSWTREQVSTTAAPPHEVNNYPPSLELDSTGRPVVAYVYSTTGNYYVAMAVRGASSWTVYTPTWNIASTVYYHRLRGNLLIDNAGRFLVPAYVSANNNQSASYLLSYHPTTQAAEFYKMGSPGFDGNNSLAWAGSSRLVARTNTGIWDLNVGSMLSSSSGTWSPTEQNGTGVGDIVWAQNKPTILHHHGNALELVTPQSNGFWTFTQLGSSSGRTASLATQANGTVSLCYQANNRVMFQ